MSRLSKALAAMLLLLASITAVVACATRGRPLEDTQWTLVEWTLSSLSPDEFTITAAFADGQLSGRSGVNHYAGAYELGPGDAFAVGRLTSTKMAGPEPAMRAEGAYRTLLAQAKSYRVTDGSLTLYDEGGNESLIFSATRR